MKKRMIVVGLKDDNSSREVLLRLLNFVVIKGDSVLAVHVQESDGCEFDPNTFHIHEDLCKSKQVRTNRIFYLLVVNDLLFLVTRKDDTSYIGCRWIFK